jgi:hypothetical protein
MTGTVPRDGVANDRRADAPGRPRGGSPPASGDRHDGDRHDVEGSPDTSPDGPIKVSHARHEPVDGS